MDLIRILKDRKSTLSKSHRMIADYILNNYEKAAFMTASKLGDAVGVSESTVIRFALLLGYEGYPQLQDALIKTAHNKMTIVQRMEVTKSRIGENDVLSSVLQSDMDKIRLTLEKLDINTFNTVVEEILKAKYIYIIGIRSASALAEFMGFYFNLIFNNIRVVHNVSVNEVFEQVIHIEPGDLLIGISFPRYSNRTIKAIKYANARGAKTVAITDSKMSPLCEYANYSLFAKSDMNAFVDSLVAPLSLINAVIAAVAIQKEKEITGVLQDLEDIWNENEVYDRE